MKWGSLFLPVSSTIFWGSLAVTFLLAIGVTYLAVHQANRRRLAWRLLASYTALLALFALALQPQWLSSLQPLSGLLLTPGADSQALPSLADSLRKSSRVFALTESEKLKSIFPNRQTVPDAAYLKRHFPEIDFLQVVGHGLNEYDWDALDSIQIQSHFTPLPLGIKQAHWTRELVIGQSLRVHGALTGLHDEEYRLFLSDLGGDVDSTKITGPNDARFALQARPREIGKYLYDIRLQSADGKVLLEEKIDIAVSKPQPLKILALESSVRFETKYLKNWASQNQNAMAMRSTISRERFRFEHLNCPPADLRRLTSELLRDFDMVLIDGKTLQALSPAERQALRSAVEQEGIGVLLIPDEMILANEQKNFSHRDFFLGFRFEAFTELDRRLIKPRGPGINNRGITAIPAEPFAIQNAWGLQPLLKDEMERLLAGAIHRGNGLVGLSLIRDSYRWILEGHAKYHAAYWSYLLTTLARRDQLKDCWAMPATQPIVVDQPLALTVETNAANPVGLIATEAGDTDSIYLQQDHLEPRRWRGTFWPRESGWHQIAIVGGEACWFYVYEQANWQTWQAAQKIAATQRHAARYANLSTERQRPLAPQAKPMSLFWLFIIFLVCSAYLWLERKI